MDTVCHKAETAADEPMTLDTFLSWYTAGFLQLNTKYTCLVLHLSLSSQSNAVSITSVSNVAFLSHRTVVIAHLH